MNIKEKLYLACNDFLNERHKVVINRIQSIQESLKSETKSSAGDKHETGRAMLQLEREKAGNQLLAIEQQQKVLKRISVQNSTDVVRLGSVVETDKKKFYLAIIGSSSDISTFDQSGLYLKIACGYRAL